MGALMTCVAFAASLVLAFRGVSVLSGERVQALIAGPAGSTTGARLPRRFRGVLDPGRKPFRVVSAMACAWLGSRLAGWPAAAMGVAAGAGLPVFVYRRRRRRRDDLLEGQLAELAEACGLALRGGFSPAQALEIAADEVEEPLAALVRTAVRQRGLGTSFERSLAWLVDSLGTEDARLFGLVVGAHHRSGGNVSGALAEVAATIRQRIAVRRELRALTAQGRISGAILGALPVAFFLVMAVTSHRELAPVYRSPAGAAMVVTGLVFEVLAYAWIRHLLRVAM
jgi:tight adherence protein B